MTTIIASLKSALTGYGKYRGREGHYSFLLHRLTGLGILLFLIIHIVDTATVYFFPELYNHAIEIYRKPLFMIGEIGIVFSVVFHGVNGIRIAYVDMVKPSNWTIEKQRKAARAVLILSIVIWLPAAVIMLKSLIEHL
ncbi:MAG: succinate dehydrogenase, cytochrome b556 subunit [Chloroflexota bacterium]